VLRYSKRTLAYGAEMQKITPLFTVRDETIEDAQAAADLLIRCPEVESDRIYLIGHSLGGMLAPRIAASDSQISGIVIPAGPFHEVNRHRAFRTKS
jgi:dienelactone hydrolase